MSTQPMINKLLIENIVPIWFQSIVDFVDINTIVGQFLGATFSLLVGIAIARWEYKHQRIKKQNNWYKRAHYITERLQTIRSDTIESMNEGYQYSSLQRYNGASDQLQSLLSDANDDVHITILGLMEDVIMKTKYIEYIIENDVEVDTTGSLRTHNDILRDRALMLQYVIEIESGCDFERVLSDQNRKRARSELKSRLENSPESTRKRFL